jgi:LmbE family N-acetylglucosaminyl deacetylase
VTGPLLVVSPHCDDAVFGCAGLVARQPGAQVVTVFAGGPATAAFPLTRWDADSGFRAGDDVMAARRREDAASLSRLGATPRWLDFVDAQYGPSPPAEAVARALDAVVRATAPATVAIPLGLFHSDHRLVHGACLLVMRRHPALTWLAYEEPMYRRVPGLVHDRLAALRTAGLSPAPFESVDAVPLDTKRAALECYASQLRALQAPGMPGFDDALAPERYWRLTPRAEAVA